MTVQTDRREAATAAPAGRRRALRRSPANRAGHPGRASRRRTRSTGLLFVAPAALVYGTFVLTPWLQSIWYSFYDWDGIGVATWVGVDNYVEVLTNDRLFGAFLHAFGFMVFYTVIPVSLGLVLAAALAARRRRGDTALRTILFLPQILPLVAVGVVWRLIYSEEGPLNQVLSLIGLEQYTRAWLGDFTFAYLAVGFVGTWVSTGLCTVLLLAGIQKIDPSLYEAAKLDGANAWQEFRNITVPSLHREISVAATVTLISALASFDVVYVMTGGGPGNETTVPGVLIYQLVFTANRVGVACALGAVLSIVLIVVVALLNRIGRDKS
jgi:raffinose/stachyose/melibiose transport system permease protein